MNSILDIIYIPFGYVLRFFNSICGGQYVLTLLLFALLVKVLMLPISIRQQKNMVKGALLRPKMAIIEKKYKNLNDRDSLMKKNNEIREMQQREGYSPLSGCLPLLIQFPVLIALYNIIRAPLTYIARFSEKLVAQIQNITMGNQDIDTTGEVAWKTIKNLDQFNMISAIKENPDAFSGLEGFSTANIPNFEIFNGWINLADKPSTVFSGGNFWLIVIPLVTLIGSFATMLLTQRFNGNSQAQMSGQTEEQAKSMKIMNWIMPLMSVWISFIVSSALGVYWFFQSIFTIVQMVILNRIMPMPVITEEDIREYERSLKKKPKAIREVDPEAPKPRSLHHIDDDD